MEVRVILDSDSNIYLTSEKQSKGLISINYEKDNGKVIKIVLVDELVVAELIEALQRIRELFEFGLD